jgi:hypothetical protein
VLGVGSNQTHESETKMISPPCKLAVAATWPVSFADSWFMIRLRSPTVQSATGLQQLAHGPQVSGSENALPHLLRKPLPAEQAAAVLAKV